jgi:hypothetical protein
MRQTPFATIIPDLIPQKNAKVPYNVHCLPIETLFNYEDSDEDIEYRDVRNEMKHIMCFSFHCFLQMMINETEVRIYSISQKAAESLKEQADWMIQMICLNDTKDISYCYQQIIDNCIEEDVGELLRDTSIQSYMDAYIRQVALNPKLSLESCQCKQVGIQTVLKVVNNTPGPMNSYIEQRVMPPSTRSDANRIQKKRKIKYNDTNNNI